jgi:putative ABC transport system permease protein
MLTRLMADLLYKVSPRDPIVFGTALIILIVVAFIACFVPAWRATRIDPVQALHEQG